MPAVLPRLTFLTEFDADGVLAIENAVEVNPLSWAELKSLRASPGVNGRLAVSDEGAGAGGRVLGFTLYRIGPADVELIRLTVRPGCRRRGVGRALAGRLAGMLEAWRRDAITATVRETALGSQLFLSRLGYRGTGVVRDAFADTGEDGFTMVFTRPGAAGRTA